MNDASHRLTDSPLFTCLLQSAKQTNPSHQANSIHLCSLLRSGCIKAPALHSLFVRLFLMLAPDSPAFLCLISWFQPCLSPTTLPHLSPGNYPSLLSLTTILACPFLGSTCPLPWLSGYCLIQLYRVSATSISSVASCSSVTLIISSLREYETEFHRHYSPVTWFGLTEPNLQSPPEIVKGQRP